MRTTSRSDREHVTRDNLRSFPAHFARLCVYRGGYRSRIREFISLFSPVVVGASPSTLPIFEPNYPLCN